MHALAHVVPRQVVVLVLGVGAHRANETRAPVVLQRKDDEKIGRVQGAVQFAVHHRAARVDVGDIKEMVVGAAWKTDLQGLAHGGVRAVAAGEIGGLARVGAAIGAFEAGAHTGRRFLERHELRLALDLDAGLSEAIDQQAFVLVLRIDQRIGKRTEIRAHFSENDVRDLFTGASRD